MTWVRRHDLIIGFYASWMTLFTVATLWSWPWGW